MCTAPLCTALIAVDYEHRGKHIASNMMQNFERRAMLVHDVDSVALHCRVWFRLCLDNFAGTFLMLYVFIYRTYNRLRIGLPCPCTSNYIMKLY